MEVVEELPWVTTAKFSVGGYQLPEVDLTPALAIGVIALTAYALLLHTSGMRSQDRARNHAYPVNAQRS
jgi:hypothetical protein